MTWCCAQAQTFNTITSTQPRFRAERTVVYNEKKASPESDTSHLFELKDYSPSADQPINEAKRTRHLLSVSYPLREIHITSPFGYRRDPITGKADAFHSGVDLRAHLEPVYAMFPGVVAKCGYDKRSGYYVVTKHGELTISYCHLARIKVQEGTYVSAGMPLAISGRSGRSTGFHLHLGARLSGKRINASQLFKIVEAHL